MLGYAPAGTGVQFFRAEQKKLRIVPSFFVIAMPINELYLTQSNRNIRLSEYWLLLSQDFEVFSQKMNFLIVEE